MISLVFMRTDSCHDKQNLNVEIYLAKKSVNIEIPAVIHYTAAYTFIFSKLLRRVTEKDEKQKN